MSVEGMDSERGGLEVIRLAAREEFHHVLQVGEAVIDRRGREQEYRLVTYEFKHLPVTRGPSPPFALDAGVAEVVCLVNDDDIGHLFDTFQIRGLPVAVQVCVVEDDEVREDAVQVRQIAVERLLPDGLTGRFRHEECDALALFFNQPLDQHHADESFTQADAVAQKRPSLLPSGPENILSARVRRW